MSLDLATMERWLTDWCRFLAGEVLFADVLLLPNGMSKVGVYT